MRRNRFSIKTFVYWNTLSEVFSHKVHRDEALTPSNKLQSMLSKAVEVPPRIETIFPHELCNRWKTQTWIWTETELSITIFRWLHQPKTKHIWSNFSGKAYDFFLYVWEYEAGIKSRNNWRNVLRPHIFLVKHDKCVFSSGRLCMVKLHA